MIRGKRILSALLALLITAGTSACGSSAVKDPQETQVPAETAAAETPEPAKTAAPRKTPEPAETEEPEVHYSDPAAFAAFDAYIEGYTENYEAFRDREVRIGETTFGATGYTAEKTMQYKDAEHEAAQDPETLAPGAVGMVRTGYYTKLGGQTAFLVYDPAEEPAAFEDCVIIGFRDLEGAVFSGGITLSEGAQDPAVLDGIIALLGEPAEIRGTVKETYQSAVYHWRDKDGIHELSLAVYKEGDLFEINGMSYVNYEAVEKTQ